MRSAGSEQGCGELLVEPEGDRSLKKRGVLSGQGLSVSAYVEEIAEHGKDSALSGQSSPNLVVQ